LVVDDEPDARDVLVRIVSAVGNGLKAHAAEDGMKALELIEAQLPRIILLDLMMPRMDGFEVIKRLSARVETRQVPVVVISAAAPSELHLLKVPGVMAVLRKGQFEIPLLMTIIRQAVWGKAAITDSQTPVASSVVANAPVSCQATMPETGSSAPQTPESDMHEKCLLKIEMKKEEARVDEQKPTVEPNDGAGPSERGVSRSNYIKTMF